MRKYIQKSDHICEEASQGGWREGRNGGTTVSRYLVIFGTVRR